MCLAVPAQVETADQDTAVVDVQGNRLRVCTVLVGPLKPGQWVLVHAGYAITTLEPDEAAETWQLLTAQTPPPTPNPQGPLP
jgi:hydrogenase expression/formation protein HypC